MKNLLKFLLIGGSVMCVFSIILGPVPPLKEPNLVNNALNTPKFLMI